MTTDLIAFLTGLVVLTECLFLFPLSESLGEEQTYKEAFKKNLKLHLIIGLFGFLLVHLVFLSKVYASPWVMIPGVPVVGFLGALAVYRWETR